MGLGAFLKGAVKGVKGAVKKILPKKDSNSEGGSRRAFPSAPLMNSAFVFIKPHANTRAVQDLVVAKLTSKRVKILSEGDIAAAKIDKDKLIDQHYYAIASKATLLKPDQLTSPGRQVRGEVRHRVETGARRQARLQRHRRVH
jgi:hypothetical protein